MAKGQRGQQQGFAPGNQQAGYAGNVWNQWLQGVQWSQQGAPYGQGGGQYGQYTIPAQITQGPNGQPVVLVQLTQLPAGTSIKQLVVQTPSGQPQVFPLQRIGTKGTGGQFTGTQQQGISRKGGANLGSQTGQYAMLPANQTAAIKQLRSLANTLGIPLHMIASGSANMGGQQGFQQTKKRRQTART